MPATAVITTSKNSSPNSTAVTHNNDLLDLLGSLDLNTPTVAAPTLPLQPQSSSTPIFSPTSTNNFLVDGLLNTPSVQNGLFGNLKKFSFRDKLHINYYIHIIVIYIIAETPSIVVLDKSGLKITFKLERPPDIPDLLVINMLAENSGSAILTDFLFQAAVPRVRH